ncbi:MAG: cell division protein SepF [Lachnospiraceae bacterium]|nr:cell division protein SepF [Lachnospiraceae bacterium]
MSVIDKFLDAIKMNDDVLEDDYLDDEYDEDSYDDPEEERPKKRILRRNDDEEDLRPKKQAFRRNDDDAYESRRPAAKEADSYAEEPRVQPQKQMGTRTSTRSGSKISPMRTPGSRRTSGMQVCVIKPRSIEDSREVADTLLDECTVILNMEGVDFELAQRIIDFTCGSCYALHGKIQKVSNYIFIITPVNVDISGDIQEMVGSSYDMPSFGTSF